MPNTTKVVHISTGKVIDALVLGEGSWQRIYHPEHLKKDGTPNQTRRPDGWMVSEGSVVESYYAPYDPERESNADMIRAHIANLRDLIIEDTQRLLALYEIKKGD